MSDADKVELLQGFYRDEILKNAKLADEVDDLLIENSDLKEDDSEQLHEIERLRKSLSDLKKIKMGDNTDDIDSIRYGLPETEKSPAATEDS